MKDNKYFDNNVMMVVEIEFENGGRHRETMRGAEVDKYLDNHCQDGYAYFSDCDYCTTQPDDWCRKVLNTAYLNWTKNFDWVKKQGVCSLWELVTWIIDRQLVR